MLSAHEIATLFVLSNASTWENVDPGDLESLVRHRLVMLPAAEAAASFPCLTEKGRSILHAVIATG